MTDHRNEPLHGLVPSSIGGADELVINDDAAWCWFQDERALVDPGSRLLLAGSVAAEDGAGAPTRAGSVELSVVDLEAGTSRIVTLHENLEADDHNAPALLRRSDGRWLAVYTRHKTDDLTRYRLSEPLDPTTWGAERVVDWSERTGGIGVTYSNLHRLDDRLVCFTRAVNDDQCALVSHDEGGSWSYAGKLFSRPKVGYVNGYTRYASGGGRIDLVTTDHHPRDFDNAIYHGYLEHGALHRSDGAVVDAHALEGAAPSQAELTTVVAAGQEINGARMHHSWTTDIRRGADGSVVAVLTARVDEPAHPAEAFERMRPVLDHRFLYARLAPGATEWTVRQLARAGAGLLPHEQDYTGLAAIDPDDVDRVVVSTRIDPRDGSVLGHHELFHGVTDDEGASWRWTPLTTGSTVDNLRPILAPGDPERLHLLWFRGAMESSQRYRCEAVLRVFEREAARSAHRQE